MPNFICTTCGTQYLEGEQPPAICAICEDDRQYVKKTGQQWTTLEKLRLTNRNSLKAKEPGLIGIGTEPHFAIGQRALFLRTPTANILWDCVSLLDEVLIDAIKALGASRPLPSPILIITPAWSSGAGPSAVCPFTSMPPTGSG